MVGERVAHRSLRKIMDAISFERARVTRSILLEARAGSFTTLSPTPQRHRPCRGKDSANTPNHIGETCISHANFVVWRGKGNSVRGEGKYARNMTGGSRTRSCAMMQDRLPRVQRGGERAGEYERCARLTLTSVIRERNYILLSPEKSNQIVTNHR